MKVKLLKGVLTVLSLICILCIPVTPIYAEPQGTDGTEMQVIAPEKLEIQLGADWAGVEFQLKTDSGCIPYHSRRRRRCSENGTGRQQILCADLYEFIRICPRSDAGPCHNRGSAK
ncbi:MAG: hypothetical protein ACLSB9_18885 [Hydrogeniiclostridium mannosilyticum]